MFNKELEDLKSKQAKMYSTIPEMKNTLQGINSRIMGAEEWISDIEDIMVEITATGKKKIKEWKNLKIKRSLRNIKYTNIHIKDIQKEKREKGPEKIFEEIIADNFLNMGKETLTQVEEPQRILHRISPKRNTVRQILMKLTKIKYEENILKATREKQRITYKGTPIRITADLSAESLKDRSGKIYLRWWRGET